MAVKESQARRGPGLGTFERYLTLWGLLPHWGGNPPRGAMMLDVLSSGAVLATTVIGVLIEIPVMLALGRVSLPMRDLLVPRARPAQEVA